MVPHHAAHSMLVVVDIQERLVPAMPTEAMTELLRAASILFEASTATGVPILATEQYPKGLGPTVAAIATALTARSVTPIPKLSFSAMQEPAFATALGHKGPKHAVVVGMEAHICVLQTVRDLRAAGIDVWVPWDGVVSRRPRDRDVALTLCERFGAYVTSSESIAFDWLERAGTDGFRAVSKVVR